MAALKRLILGLMLIAGMLAAVAYALPQQVAMARSTVINAPESDIFPYLVSLRKFNEWSPWAARDPVMNLIVVGALRFMTASLSWPVTY